MQAYTQAYLQKSGPWAWRWIQLFGLALCSGPLVPNSSPDNGKRPAVEWPNFGGRPSVLARRRASRPREIILGGGDRSSFKIGRFFARTCYFISAPRSASHRAKPRFARHDGPMIELVHAKGRCRTDCVRSWNLQSFAMPQQCGERLRLDWKVAEAINCIYARRDELADSLKDVDVDLAVLLKARVAQRDAGRALRDHIR